MRGKLTISYQCPNCDREYDITTWPIIPARIYGPPELCYPAEGGEFEPEECPHCQHPARADKVYDQAEDEARNLRDEYLEAQAEARREARENR